MRNIVLIFTLSLLLLTLACKESSQATLQVTTESANSLIKFQRHLEPLSFDQPVAMLQEQSNSHIWYVVEKSGQIFHIDDEVKPLQKNIFIDIRDRVDASRNEAGLLGMAFHPQYANNKRVFLSYTASGDPLTSVLSEFVRIDNSKSMNMDSEKVIIRVSQPYSNHNGGTIHFDNSGFLVFGLGDGGSAGDPQQHGQNRQSLLGSFIRLDVDSQSPYGIPKDNPFVNVEGVRPEIYAYGLRNPWKWSFDRKTGQLWAADVGQNEWEEVNQIKSGGNYGWNLKEGNHVYKNSNGNSMTLISPIAEYSHEGGHCSVTGGYVYRGASIRSLQNSYVFGDFCSGMIWTLTKQANNKYKQWSLVDTDFTISSFAEDNFAELYVIDYNQGSIHKIVQILKQ